MSLELVEPKCGGVEIPHDIDLTRPWCFLLEDDNNVRMHLSSALTGAGMQAVGAYTLRGADYIAKVVATLPQDRLPSLILLDGGINDEEMSCRLGEFSILRGFEGEYIYGLLKQTIEGNNIPTICISAGIMGIQDLPQARKDLFHFEIGHEQKAQEYFTALHNLFLSIKAGEL